MEKKINIGGGTCLGGVRFFYYTGRQQNRAVCVRNRHFFMKQNTICQQKKKPAGGQKALEKLCQRGDGTKSSPREKRRTKAKRRPFSRREHLVRVGRSKGNGRQQNGPKGTKKCWGRPGEKQGPENEVFEPEGLRMVASISLFERGKQPISTWKVSTF